MKAKTQTAESRREAPQFTKAQLVGAKHFDYPRDAVAAVLTDGESYTRERAETLVRTFLERKVK